MDTGYYVVVIKFESWSKF